MSLPPLFRDGMTITLDPAAGGPGKVGFRCQRGPDAITGEVSRLGWRLSDGTVEVWALVGADALQRQVRELAEANPFAFFRRAAGAISEGHCPACAVALTVWDFGPGHGPPGLTCSACGAGYLLLNVP